MIKANGTVLVSGRCVKDVGGALVVSKRPPIVDTLRRTSRQLKIIRKAVAADGYAEELQEIDSLVGVAQQEAERKLQIVENSKPAPSDAALHRETDTET